MNTQNIFVNLENELSKRLRPVQPRSEFVNRLQSNLTTQKRIQIEERNYGMALVTVSFGLFMGILSLWFFRRLF